jgi:hypothetical protein
MVMCLARTYLITNKQRKRDKRMTDSKTTTKLHEILTVEQSKKR